MARAEEIDVALQDLEARLERLRSLYEQYFIGIEKLEPVIPRQDLDRRIYALRKAQIRNTAKRFKLQTIVQRYNTLQQYWLRICREIENGTYHRHVAKAERRFGNAAAAGLGARRRGRKRAGSDPDTTDESKLSPTEQTEQSLAALLADLDPDAVLEQTLRELSFDDDEAARELGASSGGGGAGSEPPLTIELEPLEPSPREPLPSAASRLRPPPPPPRAERERPSALAAEDAAAAVAANVSMPPRRPPPRLRATAAAPEPPAPVIAEVRSAAAGSVTPEVRPPAPVSAPAWPEPSQAPPRPANASAAPPRPPRVSKPAAHAPRASAAPASPAAARAASVEPPAPRPAPTASAAAAAPTAPSVAAPAAPSAATRAAPSAATRAAQSAATEAAPSAASARPGAESPHREPGAGEAAAPDPRAARAAARSAAARAANAHKASAPSASSGLGDARLRELHQQLTQERERLNQRGKVELDVLGKSLRDTEAKLRRQYQNKNIEFRVVVKDGKAIVKPFVG